MEKDHKKYDDSDLLGTVESMKQGSAEAFRLLYDKYKDSVYRFCVRMIDDRILAKDAFQEVFIKVYEARSQFKAGSFSAWIYAITRNICINHLRARKEYETFDEGYHVPMKASDGDIGLKDFIEKAIAQLPISLKEALLLREYEECSYQEIADILDIDLSLAKVRVHRARTLLRKLLTPLVKELNES